MITFIIVIVWRLAVAHISPDVAFAVEDYILMTLFVIGDIIIFKKGRLHERK